jgi:magnesium chelatase subunit D
MTALFPFTAIVGQEHLKTALILNAVNPLIGGVLIRGEKGTAKSTLARALAELLPEISVNAGCPFNCGPGEEMPGCPHCSRENACGPVLRRMPVVTLPANATEDRVAGALDVEYALKHGARRFEPGVLAAAHRGILYIDEVNLLDDHIVDLLLDAAAMGVNTVEREGLSFSHISRFILIGTMNPEEGDLRPQLLDRFSLCVDAVALMDKNARSEIVKRRMAWEKDQASFAACYEKEQGVLAGKITAARDLLPRVSISESLVEQAARICIELDVRSHRADIVTVRAALSLAALAGRTEATEDDIRQAALFALPHRMRRRPFEESRLDPEKIDEAMRPPEKEKSGQQDSPTGQDLQDAPREETFKFGQAPDIALSHTVKSRKNVSAGGRRSKSSAENRRGRASRTGMPAGPFAGSDIAVDATLRAAAPDQIHKPVDGPFKIRPDHVRVKRRIRPPGATILLVVDASGSMAASRRMEAAKGAALALLKDAYVKRNRVALLAFRDDRCEVLLQPTDNVDLAHEHLKELPTGGRTPLAHGLAAALELAHQIRQRDAETSLMAALISDGKANVSYAQEAAAKASPFDEAADFARQLTLAHVHLVVLDTEDDFLCLGLAKKLAEVARADYVKLSQTEAVTIEQAVREQLEE